MKTCPSCGALNEDAAIQCTSLLRPQAAFYEACLISSLAPLLLRLARGFAGHSWG